jgi:hypothetical protein
VLQEVKGAEQRQDVASLVAGFLEYLPRIRKFRRFKVSKNELHTSDVLKPANFPTSILFDVNS